jgi:hypothetical protein
MAYDINQQKIKEGMEEYMKQQVNLLAVFTALKVSNTERLFNEENLSKEEKIIYIEEEKNHLDENLRLFTSPPQLYRKIIPRELDDKYLPEIKSIVEEGKKSLDNLLLSSTEGVK